MTNRQALRAAIRYVQIETGTVCNYRCVYCPVAFEPRRGGFLPMNLVEKVANELSDFPNVRQIYLNGYDEPTLNPRLAEAVKLLAPLRVRITLLTNGTRLTPAVVDELVATGADLEFDIHLAAANPVDFERVHQSKLFDSVMRNLDYLKSFDSRARIPIHVSMLGRAVDRDRPLFTELQAAFAGTSFALHCYPTNDRAGLMTNEYGLGIRRRGRLLGCDLQNRTEEWIHINASGNVVLCCQDYRENHLLGEIRQQTLTQILESETRARYQAWTCGELQAPEDYICRRCVFARTADTMRPPTKSC